MAKSTKQPLPPIIASLIRILKDCRVSGSDYKKHLMDKYLGRQALPIGKSPGN